MRTEGEHADLDADGAVAEVERILAHASEESVSRQGPGADGVLVFFGAMMAFCLVVFAALFAGLVVGTALGALVAVGAAGALLFAHGKRVASGHRR